MSVSIWIFTRAFCERAIVLFCASGLFIFPYITAPHRCLFSFICILLHANVRHLPGSFHSIGALIGHNMHLRERAQLLLTNITIPSIIHILSPAVIKCISISESEPASQPLILAHLMRDRAKKTRTELRARPLYLPAI